MSSSQTDWALTLPPALPPFTEESLVASARRGYRSLRRRWLCLGPECAERDGLRAWCKLPARIQLQEGWCCSPECLQAAVAALAASELHRIRRAPAPHAHRVPLGLTLLSQGIITAPQLRAALEAQHQAQNQAPNATRGQNEGPRPARLGEWLVRAHAASEAEVAAAVALQWARPTFPLDQSQGWRQCRNWVPLPVLEALRMLPLHCVHASAAARRRLYVGFTQSIDFHALAALAQIFECETESCIITESALTRVFDEIRALSAQAQVQDISFDHMDDAAEVASITSQYAHVVQARQIRLAALGPFLWVRLRGQRIIHLTFRSAA